MIPKTIFRLVMYYQIYLDMWIGRWYPTNILEGNSKTSWLSHSYHMCFSLSNPKMPEHQRTHMFHFWWLKHPVFDADAVFLMKSGWWFKHFLFSILYGIILPIDFHIFQRGTEKVNLLSLQVQRERAHGSGGKIQLAAHSIAYEAMGQYFRSTADSVHFKY